MRRALAMLLAGGVATGAAACSSSTPTEPAATDAVFGSITVFAAASLTETFTELADEFEASHRGTSVEVNFAGSADLATQILEGAPADVFASADEKTMATLVEAELAAGEPIDFATNLLEIAVHPGNPAGISGLTDLADPSVKLVVCAPQVPCGAATMTVAEAVDVTLSPVSEEASVTDVLGKVSSGEADAGLVYVTDVIAAGSAVDGIAFAESADAVNTYPIVALTGSETGVVADAFVAFILGPTGQSVLADAGFGPAVSP
ncbi:MAG: molybdate ABC transporter substrate-binding protein [Leifsonia flava]